MASSGTLAAPSAAPPAPPRSLSMMELMQTGRRYGLRYRHIGSAIALNGLATVIEGVTLLLLLPIVQVLQRGGKAEGLAQDGEVGRIIADLAGRIGVELSLGTLLIAMFVFVLMRQAVRYAVTLYLDYLELTLVRRFRAATFEGLVHASLDFFDARRTGNLMNDLTVELPYAIRGFLNNIRIVSLWFMMAFYAAGAVALSPVMTLIAAGVFLFVGLILRFLLRRQEVLSRRLTEANQDISSHIMDRIRAIRLVRLSGIEREEVAALDARLGRQFRATFDSRKLGGLLVVAIEPIILAATLVLLYLGVSTLNVDLGQLFVLIVIVLRLLPVFRDIMISKQLVKGASGSIAAVEGLAKAVAANRDVAGGSRELAGLDRAIAFEGVTFSYRSRDVPALNGVTVEIPARRMTALVGPSGAGKSTLVDLIPRLRQPNAGSIRIDGTPIEEFSVAALRRAIAFVPQSPIVLDVTAAEHIGMGNAGVSAQALREAARLAGALDFIEALPQGFQTRLGEGGQRLSGGQRQRLDLARALARKAPILVLDEPTSNLDAELEGQFKESIRRLRRETDLTLVVIAHRLSTIRDADRIVLMNGGRVEAFGRHDELLATNAWYANACREQSQA